MSGDRRTGCKLGRASCRWPWSARHICAAHRELMLEALIAARQLGPIRLKSGKWYQVVPSDPAPFRVIK